VTYASNLLAIDRMLSKWLYMIAMALVLVGALNWGLIGTFGFNLVAAVLGRGLAANTVYAIVGLAALFLVFRRDTYLPFLGETVLPCSLMPERTPEHADTEVTVHGLQPGAKVLFWAAEPENEGLAKLKDWRRAYLEFANAGVTTVDTTGRVTLRVRKPQPYTIPSGRRLEAHVHWRVCGDGGLIGPVQTTPVAL
jgi:uncharacterized membrane protein YuzA (DUF378 family)